MTSNIGVGRGCCQSIVEGYLTCAGVPYSTKVGGGIPAEGLLVSVDIGRAVLSHVSILRLPDCGLRGNH